MHSIKLKIYLSPFLKYNILNMTFYPFILILTFFLGLVCPVFGAQYHPTQILVQTTDNEAELMSTPAISNTLTSQTFSPKYVKKFPLLSKKKKSGFFIFSKQTEEATYLVDIDTPQNLDAALSYYKSLPNTKFAQKNYIYKTTETPENVVPNDEHYALQYAPKSINVEPAWSITSGNADTIIAIIDTGVRLNHEDLAANIWTNPNEVDDGKDNDNNLLVDDLYGWDFVDGDNTISDSAGHGTHVAGLAAAAFNNETGIAGICPNCSIMALDAGDDDGFFSTVSIINSIIYAVSKGATVINMSLGGEFPTIEESDQLFINYVKYALASGVLVVVAAGNEAEDLDSTTYLPANIDGVLTVSASKEGDVFAEEWSPPYNFAGSNYGSYVDVMAPGDNILSTYITINSDLGGRYGYETGTSMSSPIVAGIAGLLYSYAPSATTTNIFNAITQGATDIAPPGKDNETGYGLANALNSIYYLDSQAPTLTYTLTYTTWNIEADFPIEAIATDNFLLESVTLTYRYANLENTTYENWVSTNMSQLGDIYSGTIPAPPSNNITDIFFYLTASDRINKTYAPTQGESNPYNLVLSDVVPPTITFKNYSNTFIDTNSVILATLSDNVYVVTSSIGLAVGVSDTTTNYTIENTSILNYTSPTLSITAENLNLSNDTNTIRFQITATDSSGKTGTSNLTFLTKSSFDLFGPNGEGSPVVSVPNPFNPNDETTAIWYHATHSADITISIYTLGLKKVKTITRSISAGTSDLQDTWDGRDEDGNLVPNGVYIFFIEATSETGQKVVKRNKIAVVRQ